MRNRSRIFSLGTAALLPGSCARGEPAPVPPPPNEAAAGEPADTLVLAAPGGATVWLTLGRQAADSSGARCYERTIEIRRDSSRVRVPLLYTLSPPILLDDTTLRAELSRDCRPGAAYRVSLHTGQPVRIP